MHNTADYIIEKVCSDNALKVGLVGMFRLSYPNVRDERTIVFIPDEFLLLNTAPLSLPWLQTNDLFRTQNGETLPEDFAASFHNILQKVTGGEAAVIEGLGSLRRTIAEDGTVRFRLSCDESVRRLLKSRKAELDKLQNVYSDPEFLQYCDEAARLVPFTWETASQWEHALGNLIRMTAEKCDEPDNACVNADTGAYMEGEGGYAAQYFFTEEFLHSANNGTSFEPRMGSPENRVKENGSWDGPAYNVLLSRAAEAMRAGIEKVLKDGEQAKPFRINLGRFGWLNVAPFPQAITPSQSVWEYSYPSQEYMLWRAMPVEK